MYVILQFNGKNNMILSEQSDKKKKSISMMSKYSDKKEELLLKKETEYEKNNVKSIDSNIMLFINMGSEWQY